MKSKLFIVVWVAVTVAAVLWAAHQIDLFGILKRLHGG
jgi:hypothetical protein